jgi:hypothetical protein
VAAGRCQVRGAQDMGCFVMPTRGVAAGGAAAAASRAQQRSARMMSGVQLTVSWGRARTASLFSARAFGGRVPTPGGGDERAEPPGGRGLMGGCALSRSPRPPSNLHPDADDRWRRAGDDGGGGWGQGDAEVGVPPARPANLYTATQGDGAVSQSQPQRATAMLVNRSQATTPPPQHPAPRPTSVY